MPSSSMLADENIAGADGARAASEGSASRDLSVPESSRRCEVVWSHVLHASKQTIFPSINLRLELLAILEAFATGDVMHFSSQEAR